MTDLGDLGGWEREPLSEQDLAIAALVGCTAMRRVYARRPLTKC